MDGSGFHQVVFFIPLTTHYHIGPKNTRTVSKHITQAAPGSNVISKRCLHNHSFNGTLKDISSSHFTFHMIKAINGEALP